VSDRYVAYHRQRARAGVCMQVTGATPVAPSVEWADICLWNIDDSVIPGYQRLARAVREEGSRMLAQLAHDLQHDPDTMARTERLKERLLDHPQVVESSVALWNALRRALTASLADPEGAVRTRLGAELVAFGERLRNDGQLRARLEYTPMQEILNALDDEMTGVQRVCAVVSEVVATTFFAAADPTAWITEGTR